MEDTRKLLGFQDSLLTGSHVQLLIVKPALFSGVVLLIMRVISFMRVLAGQWSSSSS